MATFEEKLAVLIENFGSDFFEDLIRRKRISIEDFSSIHYLESGDYTLEALLMRLDDTRSCRCQKDSA